jgi:hypothetical protein
MDSDQLKKREERKRDAAYDPVLRWKHIQQTITWAEANLCPEHRRNRPRTARTCAGNRRGTLRQGQRPA